MSLRKTLFKGAATLSLGSAASQALTLVRNILVAHALTQTDIGIGSTFLAVILLLEMLGNLRPDALLIQAQDGNSPELQASAQVLEFCRGLAFSLLLYASAVPVALWYGAPEVVWAFRALAVVPLLEGLAHLDSKRLQRKFDYIPDLWVTLTPHIIVTALAWPLATWLRDYSAILYLILLRVVASVVLSHLVARRPYRWNLNRVQIGRFLAYGAPLMANGILLFLIAQGDRLIIGTKYTRYSLAALGLFAMAWSTTAAVQMLVSRVITPLLFPLLVRAKQGQADFVGIYGKSCQALAILAAATCIPFFLAGGPMMAFVYGEGYRAAGSFIGWLAAAQSIRMLRSVPIIASLAVADTANPFIANAFRACSLLAAVAAALLNADLVWIAISALPGEVLALLASTIRLSRRTDLRLSLNLIPSAYTLAVVTAAWGCSTFLVDKSPVTLALGCLLSMVVAIGAGLAMFPSLTQEIAPTLRMIRDRYASGSSNARSR